MKNVSVGIDIGGTNTAIGIVDERGTVLEKGGIPTSTSGDVKDYVKAVADAVKSMIDHLRTVNEDIEVLGIGIGAPNGNYHRGTIEHAPNLSFKGIVPFVDLMKEQFPGLDAIALTNDANAATIGEMVYGGAKGMKNFVMFTLGTGLGSGIVVNGELVYGADGFAGECGHFTIVPDGRMCGCGCRGHLEAYVSAPGMKRTAFELLAEYNATDSMLADKSFKELDSKMIYDAAVAGDEIALKVFDITGDYLARGMATTISHTSPKAIFLFGGPTAAGDLIFEPAKKHLNKYLMSIFRDKVSILPSQLDSGDAAIVGASALVYSEINK